jgi:hypothetical protein
MNTQTDTTNTLQSTEAFPLEDHSIPAHEVLAEQQSALADETFVPTFIP